MTLLTGQPNALVFAGAVLPKRIIKLNLLNSSFHSVTLSDRPQ